MDIQEKEQLEQMTDTQIEIAMRSALGFPEVGYTKNWNDIMPVANEYGMTIRLEPQVSYVRCWNDDTNEEVFCYHPNPKRAICEVFLMAFAPKIANC